MGECRLHFCRELCTKGPRYSLGGREIWDLLLFQRTLGDYSILIPSAPTATCKISLSLLDRHIYTRTVTVVVPVGVNDEIQDLACVDRNARQTKSLGWPTIRNGSCG
jgi:hypothetical protein